MQIIYIHGLNSSSQAVKGQKLTAYCAQHHPDIRVITPDLNMSPLAVMKKLQELIAQDDNTALVGSSLGGFFATACVAKYNIPAVLLNPSVRPFDSLQRFITEANADENDLDVVLYTTDYGWNITRRDFAELQTLYKHVPENADQILVLLKTADEVLDYQQAEQHYSQAGAVSQLIIDQGGDHRMLDVDEKFPIIMQFLLTKLAQNTR